MFCQHPAWFISLSAIETCNLLLKLGILFKNIWCPQQMFPSLRNMETMLPKFQCFPDFTCWPFSSWWFSWWFCGWCFLRELFYRLPPSTTRLQYTQQHLYLPPPSLLREQIDQVCIARAMLRRKCFPVCAAWKHNIHFVSRAFARPTNIRSNNVFATMCPWRRMAGHH